MRQIDQDSSNDQAPLQFGRLAKTTGFLTRRLHNLLVGSWARDLALAPGGTTPVQAGLLILIKENPGVTQARLLKALEVESATLVRSTSRLLDAGLIEKVRSKHDKRVYNLNLTETGRNLLEQIEYAMEVREQRLTEQIDPEELRTFHRVSRQLIAKTSVGAHSGILDGLLLPGTDDHRARVRR